MEENISFFKYIYQEDIFIIDEPRITEENPVVVSSAAILEEKKLPPVAEEPKPVSFFGQNNRKLLILVNDSDNDLVSQPELEFLMRIIENGLNYTKNDIALVNLASWPIKQILEEIPHDYILAFDIDKSFFNSKMPDYQPGENAGKKILFGEKLIDIAENVSKKASLWSALKLMFNIQNK